MRILCVFELGSPIESLSHLRQCVDSLRRHNDNVEVHLALKSDSGNADVSWADKIYGTPALKVKSDHDAHGYWRYLHTTGWTDPNLRVANCQIWGGLYKMIKPDYILSAGSPSAVLTASLHGIKVIHAGNGQFMPDSNSWPEICPFPELEAWLFVVTKLSAKRLFDHPGIVFSSKTIDVDRNGAFLHVYDDAIAQDGAEFSGDVLAIWDIRHELTGELIDLGRAIWKERFVLKSPEDFRASGFGLGSIKKNNPLIIGNYDALSMSLALSGKFGYMGAPLTRLQYAVAERAELKRLSYRLDEHLMMLRAHADEPFMLQSHGLSRGKENDSSFINIDLVMKLLVR